MSLRDWIEEDAARLAGVLVRGIVKRVAESKMVRELQLQILADDDDDDVEHFEPYGFSSSPVAETDDGAPEAVLAALNGDPGQYVAIVVADRRFRPTDLSAGEVVVFDDLGQFIKLARTKVVVEGPDIELGDGATKGVARDGDSITIDVSTDLTFVAWINGVQTALAAAGSAHPSPYAGNATITGEVSSASATVKAVD
jgi:phage gp45-like